MKIRKWIIRGKVNLKKANDYVKKHRGYTDGQYVYSKKSCFGNADEATLFKTHAAAKSMHTNLLNYQKNYDHSPYVEDLEIIEAQVRF